MVTHPYGHEFGDTGFATPQGDEPGGYANLLKAIRGGIMGGNEYRVQNKPRFRVVADAAQSINNAAYPPATSITWTSAPVDTDSLWNSSLATRVTIKTPGVYQVNYQVEWAAAAGTNRQAWVQLNLVNGFRYAHSFIPAPAALAHVNWGSTPMSLNAQDTLELVVYQDSGAALALSPQAGLYYGAEMSGTLISTL